LSTFVGLGAFCPKERVPRQKNSDSRQTNKGEDEGFGREPPSRCIGVLVTSRRISSLYYQQLIRHGVPVDVPISYVDDTITADSKAKQRY
jgi:hypothetical protein